MGPRVVVVVSYYADGSEYPRSGRRDAQGAMYWANIAVSAATLRHVAGPDVEFIVAAGDEPPAPSDRILATAGAEIRRLPFAHRPPPGFYHRYAGTFFVLDAMTALLPEVAPDDVLLFADPDIVWVSSLDPLVEEVRRGGLVGYALDVPEDVPLVDLSRREQSELRRQMTGTGPGPDDPALTHFGGELYGLLGSELTSLLPEVEALWQESLRRFERGERHHNLEEHVVNAAVWARGETDGRANPFIQRVRTLPAPFGTRERATDDLVAWHLPLEKDKGFLDVHRHLADGGTLPVDGDELRVWLRRRLGIAPTGGRRAADLARQVKWTVTGRSRVDNPTYYGL